MNNVNEVNISFPEASNYSDAVSKVTNKEFPILLIIGRNIPNEFKDELIDVRYGKDVIGSWITVCYLFSKYKSKDNPCFVGSQKMPPLIIEIKETDIGLLLFSILTIGQQELTDQLILFLLRMTWIFFYSRQFLSEQFFVDNIIDSLVHFLLPLQDKNPINKSLINQLIDGTPDSKTLCNTRCNNEKSSN